MSNLQFQELAVDVPLRFKFFDGKNVNQMPLLLSGTNENGEVVDVQREPMTPKQLLYNRVHGENKNDRDLLRDNYIDTACAVITDPRGSGEVVVGLYHDAVVKELVNSLNPKNKNDLNGNGSLPVSLDHYQAIRKQGFIIGSNIANNLRNNAYSEKKVREAFWDYIAEGDVRLVMENLSLVQESEGGDMENRMGLWLSWLSSNPGWRLLCVGSVGSDYSGAGGSGNLDYLFVKYGRLVGVAPEAPIAREKSDDNKIVQPNLEQILDVINNPDLNREDMVTAMSRLWNRQANNIYS